MQRATITTTPVDVRNPTRRSPGAWRERTVFGATFILAWCALDRLVTSPPTAISATVALTTAAAVVATGERLAGGGPLRQVARRLGLAQPRPRSLVAAGIVAGAVLAAYLAGAALLGVDLELRANWPTVLVGVLLFHGLAEELVWRGFAFGFLRRRHPFWRAIAWSVPLIALTHFPIMVTTGIAIGAVAVLSAAVTCLPLAYLWERSGRTVWAPATVHAGIGTWQLFERSYGPSFHVLILAVSILVPLTAFLFGGRFFDADAP
jgi:membrane protease YdiL (CAAX protease family)